MAIKRNTVERLSGGRGAPPFIWASRYLSSALQLIHGRVVGRLPGGTFGGADKFCESLGHVPHRVYQNHLRRRSRCECKHNGQE